MKIEELKAQHPELYKAVLGEGHAAGKAEGLAEGKAAGIAEGKLEGEKAGAEKERTRIQSIEAIAMPGAEKIIAENKFKPEATAESVAIQIVRENKAALEAAGAQAKTDAEKLAAQAKGLGNVPGATTAEAEVDAAFENIKRAQAKK